MPIWKQEVLFKLTSAQETQGKKKKKQETCPTILPTFDS